MKKTIKHFKHSYLFLCKILKSSRRPTRCCACCDSFSGHQQHLMTSSSLSLNYHATITQIAQILLRCLNSLLYSFCYTAHNTACELYKPNVNKVKISRYRIKLKSAMLTSLRVITEAPRAWSFLNGLITVYKPPGLSTHRVQSTIIANICRG